MCHTGLVIDKNLLEWCNARPWKAYILTKDTKGVKWDLRNGGFSQKGPPVHRCVESSCPQMCWVDERNCKMLRRVHSSRFQLHKPEQGISALGLKGNQRLTDTQTAALCFRERTTERKVKEHLLSHLWRINQRVTNPEGAGLDFHIRKTKKGCISTERNFYNWSILENLKTTGWI